MPVKRHREAPHPTTTSLDAMDRCVAATTPDQADLLDWYRRYATVHRRRLAFDLDYVQRWIPPKAHVVELGAAPPLLTRALSDAGFAVTGVDIAPERFAGAATQANLTILKADIEAGPLPLDDEVADGVLCNELLEHLRINPPAVLREILRVLKPGGVLLLSTPNLTSLVGWGELLRRGRTPADPFKEYRKLDVLGHMGHVREYTPREVVSLLSQVGFNVQGVIFRGGAYQPSHPLKTLANWVVRWLPHLRRYVSVIATKPDEAHRGTP